MAIDLKETVSFDVKVMGDRTGELWFGSFKTLKRLSHRQELLRDRIMRELLGPNPAGASERAVSQAELFSELQVSLVETPAWWKEAGGGMDLADDSIIKEVWRKVMEIKMEAVAEIQKKGEEAGKVLKEIAESNELLKPKT